VGLTGGLASGKSFVAALWEAFGARVIDFDELAREAVRVGSPGLAASRELFGPKALLPDGSLNRKHVAAKIFKDAKLKEALENIVHPFTWGRMLEELALLQDEPLVVVDLPLLFEASLASFFYPVALAFVTPRVQLQRLRARDPALGKREALRRLANQWPIASKLRRADLVINNLGSLRDTIQAALKCHRRLLSPDFPFPA
jgi:dephospho-CoA kinase